MAEVNQYIREFNAGINQLVESFTQEITLENGHTVSGDFTFEDRINNNKRMEAYINGFPIPPTKEDLFEFISLLQTRKSESRFGKYFEAKYEECVAKANILYPNDPHFSSLMKNDAVIAKKKRKKRMRVYGIILAVLLLPILFFIWLDSPDPSDRCNSKINKALQNNDTEAAISCAGAYKGSTHAIQEGYTAIVNYFLQKDDLDSAKKIYDQYMAGAGSYDDLYYNSAIRKPFYDYLMKNKDYLAAEAFIVSDRMDKTVGSDEYYAYLAECVNGMCADGKNQAAIAFINRKVSSFDGWETNPEKRHYEKYSSDAAKKRLLEIVRSY